VTDPTPAEILALPMQQPNDADVATIRDYLVKLLADLWLEGEGFDSKRPFGNSCWESDLYPPLVKAGYVEGVIDEEEGWIEEISDEAEEQANELIAQAIQSFGTASATEG
jgi:hypothetical protein